MTRDIVLAADTLGPPPWPTADPFLFCVHHVDHYPEGNEQLGPAASLAGRHIGMDFAGKDGWRMYHGDVIPGFPQHPHRGFETVTLARRGYIDHSDSLGATARFGRGDVQWMTAGRGIVHSEMFPLVHRDAPNPVELFQIWLNLPQSDKMVDPHFTMMWSHTIPRHRHRDDHGRASEVQIISGRIGDLAGPEPPPSSWASRADSDVAIWIVSLEPGAQYALPPANEGTNRALYLFAGSAIIGTDAFDTPSIVQVRADAEAPLQAGDAPTELLVLQGKPIAEPIAHHGPFVMNTERELLEAFADYRRTQFGGWPWPSHGPAHPRDEGRFARHADGRTERPDA